MAGVPIVTGGVPSVALCAPSVVTRLATGTRHRRCVVVRSGSGSRGVIVMLVVHDDRRYIDGT